MRMFACTLSLMALTAVAAEAAPKATTMKSLTSKAGSTKRVAPPAKILPLFDFRGQNTRDTYNPTCERPSFEVRGTDGKYACIDVGMLAGTVATTQTSYFNGKLSSVISTFKDYAYSPINDAFVAKYGKPDRVNTKPWQSKGGASFENSVTEWDFADDSVLQLETMGSKVGEGRFTFISTKNAPPKEAPKVDF